MKQPHEVIIHTDGSSLGNPGPGGWAAILCWQDKKKELFGSFQHTTNNRMEILAAIKALEALKTPCLVNLHTDSRYLCDALEKGWIYSWIKKGWINSAKKPVKNKDLWERMLPQMKRYDLHLHWIRGHNGHPENERCDELARSAAQANPTEPDTGYEADAI